MEHYDVVDEATRQAEHETVRTIYGSATKHEGRQTYVQRTIRVAPDEHDLLFSYEGKILRNLYLVYYVHFDTTMGGRLYANVLFSATHRK